MHFGASANPKGDPEGKITFYSHIGTSVIDYALTNVENMHMIETFCIGEFNEHSDHAPIFLSMKIGMTRDVCTCCTPETRFSYIRTASWKNDDNAVINEYVRNNFDSVVTSLEDLVPCKESIDVCLDKFSNAVNSVFEDFCIKEKKVLKCSCTCHVSIQNKKRDPDKPWFDEHCGFLYRRYRDALKEFNKVRSVYNRERLNNTKKQYKSCEVRLKRQYLQLEGNMMDVLKRKNPREFFCKFSRRKTPNTSDLSLDDFFKYFQGLANAHTPQDFVELNISNECVYTELDADFTIDEIMCGIKNLRRHKSVGLDLILNEYLIEFKDLFAPLLVNLFNTILKVGYFPVVWTQGVIVPLHKKGDRNNVNNYRGITLLSQLSKLFTSLLNKRLTLWSEDENVVTDAQCGFRPGLGTRDAIFILRSIICNTLVSNKRLYCAFVDYRKAFDSVNHDKLWYKLWKYGINGRMFKIIKSIYDSVKSCVRLNGQSSQFFNLYVGLMQGEALSPMLFSLFINDLENEFMNSNCGSYQLQMLNLFILMYADDTVLISESINDLQDMLNCLKNYTERWDLTVNVDKTKIMVFRKSKKLYDNERWTFNNKPIEVVNQFSYLGLTFRYNGKFTETVNVIATQGGKACFLLQQQMKRFMLNIETQLSMFDTYVSCILNYGCEVWGYHTAEAIEKIQLKFLKKMLGIKKSVNSSMVYFELGRYSMLVKRQILIVKYWLNLLNTDNCILKTCYSQLLQLHNQKPNCKDNWIFHVKNLVCSSGFGYIWDRQFVQNEKAFLAEFTQRVHEVFVQNLRQSLNESSKCIVYRHLVDTFQIQFYLVKAIPPKMKTILCKYRVQSHTLHVETGRYTATPRERRICTLCNTNELEDEFHFILTCPIYIELRQRYIKPYYYKKPSVFKLVQLMSIKNVKILSNLSKYLKYATEKRKSLLDNP